MELINCQTPALHKNQNYSASYFEHEKFEKFLSMILKWIRMKRTLLGVKYMVYLSKEE